MDSGAIVQKNKFFAGLSESLREQIIPLLSKISVNKGEFIVTEGEPAEELYIIERGDAEVIKQETGSGTYHRLTILHSKDLIGEVSLLDREPHSASVRAISDCVLWALNFEMLQKSSKS